MTGVGWLLMLGLAEEGGCVVCGRREETNLASLLGDEGAFRDEISVVSLPSCMLEEP